MSRHSSGVPCGQTFIVSSDLNFSHISGHVSVFGGFLYGILAGTPGTIGYSKDSSHSWNLTISLKCSTVNIELLDPSELLLTSIRRFIENRCLLSPSFRRFEVLFEISSLNIG